MTRDGKIVEHKYVEHYPLILLPPYFGSKIVGPIAGATCSALMPRWVTTCSVRSP